MASRAAGHTIVPGGSKQHVRDWYLTFFIVHAVSGLGGARFGVGDNLMHIRCATLNVQETHPTPTFENSIEITHFGICSHLSNSGAEPYVPDSGFDPDYTPPLPSPDDFALNDVIGDHTTLGVAAHPSDPAQHGLVWVPVCPTSLVYIIVLTVFTGFMIETIHGMYFLLRPRHWRCNFSNPVDLHPPPW